MYHFRIKSELGQWSILNSSYNIRPIFTEHSEELS